VAKRKSRPTSREREIRTWLRGCQRENAREVRDDVRENRAADGGMISGYLIHVGPKCAGAPPYDDAFLPLDVAAQNPKLLPPYRGSCNPWDCECTTEAVPPGTTIRNCAGVIDVTGAVLPPKKRLGCLGVVVLLSLAFVLLRATF